MNGPVVQQVTELEIVRDAQFASYYLLSPFVWKSDQQFGMLLRVVNRAARAADKVARIHYATSDDGLTFHMESLPAITPGPQADDSDGCEDPTALFVGGSCHVFYSGWNEERKVSSLLLAAGPGPESLTKIGRVISSTTAMENPKEASIARGGDGDWNLFFEYSSGGASHIGLAKGHRADGPWIIVKTSIVPRREGHWDGWHLSPGPISERDTDSPLMYYNGADRNGRWRIGWVRFDANYTVSTSRCMEPLIEPPQPQGNETDIAFCASLVEDRERGYLYYSTSDKKMFCATLDWSVCNDAISRGDSILRIST